MKTDKELPLLLAEHLFATGGNLRSTHEAKALLIGHLTKRLEEITQKADKLTTHAKRKTILLKDIETALQ